jgi:hypothetical protein
MGTASAIIEKLNKIFYLNVVPDGLTFDLNIPFFTIFSTAIRKCPA